MARGIDFDKKLLINNNSTRRRLTVEKPREKQSRVNPPLGNIFAKIKQNFSPRQQKGSFISDDQSSQSMKRVRFSDVSIRQFLILDGSEGLPSLPQGFVCAWESSMSCDAHENMIKNRSPSSKTFIKESSIPISLLREKIANIQDLPIHKVIQREEESDTSEESFSDESLEIDYEDEISV